MPQWHRKLCYHVESFCARRGSQDEGESCASHFELWPSAVRQGKRLCLQCLQSNQDNIMYIRYNCTICWYWKRWKEHIALNNLCTLKFSASPSRQCCALFQIMQILQDLVSRNLLTPEYRQVRYFDHIFQGEVYTSITTIKYAGEFQVSALTLMTQILWLIPRFNRITQKFATWHPVNCLPNWIIVMSRQNKQGQAFEIRPQIILSEHELCLIFLR